MQTKPRRKPGITICESDYNRLSNLAAACEQDNPVIAACLMNEIDRARVVSDRSMRAAFVRMGSTVNYTVDGDENRTVTLVYPADADIEVGRISITTPVGTALIGLKAGQSIDFLTGNGRSHDLTVIEVMQNRQGCSGE